MWKCCNCHSREVSRSARPERSPKIQRWSFLISGALAALPLTVQQEAHGWLLIYVNSNRLVIPRFYDRGINVAGKEAWKQTPCFLEKTLWLQSHLHFWIHWAQSEFNDFRAVKSITWYSNRKKAFLLEIVLKDLWARISWIVSPLAASHLGRLVKRGHE